MSSRSDSGSRAPVLVLADKEDDLIPKVFFEMRFEAVPEPFRLPDVYCGLT